MMIEFVIERRSSAQQGEELVPFLMRGADFRAATPTTARAVISVVPIVFLLLFGEGVVSPILPLYSATLGAGAMLIGVVVAAYGIARLSLGIPAGYLSDRIGPRHLLFWGPVLAAIASALAAWSDNLGQLIAYARMNEIVPPWSK